MVKQTDELAFEKELINRLVNLGGTKQWKYESKIKTTEQLWANFKSILERNNQDKLVEPLSENEFKQVKAEISKLKTPYQAGQFLYGMNGISQIEIDRDNGEHVYLTIFDQGWEGC